ncbi:hypothetical protein B0O80DRAFT_176637 [Mortierella sp. GBAus27b]|nr:hypothetical protein BGX31_003526 [Mortierella sp. GBA43]KAI8348767.1 hypothetical protein B0O80DRAFT_176637 [Mortierella sp. GBAus27b]
MEGVNSDDIVQFCNITSADPDVAANYLTVCDGSLERAITLFMESGGVDLAGTTSANSSSNNNKKGSRRSRSPSAEPPAAGGAGGSGSGSGGIDRDEEIARSLQEQDRRAAGANIRAPIAPRHDVLFEDDYGRGAANMFGGSTRPHPQSSVFLPPDSTTLAREPFRDFAAESTRDGKTPRTSKLAELFRAPEDIMAKGNFEQSRNVAKKESKWLMVNIQDAGIFACQVLNRDLWSDPDVKEVVRENFIFLQFYSDSAEGKKYTAYYPFKEEFPHIAIIDPRTAERVHVWGTIIDAEKFRGDVELFLIDNSLADSTSTPSQPKKKKLVRDVSDMTEEEQIQAAMLASMGGDTPIADAVDEEEAPPAAAAAAVDEEPPAEPVEEMSVFDSIQPVRHEEPTDPATSTRLGFRLSDGSRLMHRFSKNAPVRALFEFVKAEVEDARSQPFELVFLGRQLLEEVDKTLADAGIENAQIMVQM